MRLPMRLPLRMPLRIRLPPVVRSSPMKTRITLSLVGLILAGCSRKEEISEIQPAAPQSERTYRHPVHGFVIRVPDGWDIKDTGTQGAIAVTLTSPRKNPEDTFRENFSVQVQPNPTGLTAQQCFDDGLAERKLVKDFALLTTTEELIGKDRAVGAVFAMTLESAERRMDVKALSYTIVHGKNIYTLTAVATPETFDEFKGLFRGMALAFQPE
jgi:hypothetical protein